MATSNLPISVSLLLRTFPWVSSLVCSGWTQTFLSELKNKGRKLGGEGREEGGKSLFKFTILQPNRPVLGSERQCAQTQLAATKEESEAAPINMLWSFWKEQKGSTGAHSFLQALAWLFTRCSLILNHHRHNPGASSTSCNKVPQTDILLWLKRELHRLTPLLHELVAFY